MISAYFQVEWYRQPRVVAALVLSLLLHGLLVGLLPGWRIRNVQTPPILSVELPAMPVPQAAPEIVPPKPEQKIPPRPIVTRSRSDFMLPKPPPELPRESAAPPQPAPVVETTAKPVEALAIPVAKAVPETAWIDGYGRTLSTLIARYQRYPHVALLRSWQGTAQLQLIISGTGKMLSASVLRSSGFEVLDKQALEMVQRAAPFPEPPQALREREVTVMVPIVFKLND
ncbi:MAG: TonB family protein [Burkholderiales bacterium]